MPDRPSAIVPVAETAAYLNWLLYGDPGVGKSVLACSAANEVPTLVVKSRSDNLQSVRNQGYGEAKVWEVENWNDMDEVETYLKYDDHGFGIVSLDTITLFQELGLENIMQELIDQGKNHRKLYLPDKGEYGQNMNRLSMWVRNVKALPFHFIVVAHAFVWQEDQQDEERRWPLIQGKGMPSKISGYMNLVTYMTAGTNDDGIYVRKIHARKEEDFFAKDGWDAFPKGFMNDPTLPKLLSIIEGKTPKASGTVGPAKKVAAKKAVAAKKVTAAKKTAGVAKKTTPAKVAGAAKVVIARKGS